MALTQNTSAQTRRIRPHWRVPRNRHFVVQLHLQHIDRIPFMRQIVFFVVDDNRDININYNANRNLCGIRKTADIVISDMAPANADKRQRKEKKQTNNMLAVCDQQQ